MRIQIPSRKAAIYIVLIAAAVGVWDMARKSMLNYEAGWDSAPRLSGVGYTYHVLLLEQDTKKAMHFRIFAPSLDCEGPAMVYPRSEAGLAYVNGKILRRLRQLAAEQSPDMR